MDNSRNAVNPRTPSATHICCSDYTHIMRHRDLINYTMCMGQYSTHTTSLKQLNYLIHSCFYDCFT